MKLHVPVTALLFSLLATCGSVGVSAEVEAFAHSVEVIRSPGMALSGRHVRFPVQVRGRSVVSDESLRFSALSQSILPARCVRRRSAEGVVALTAADNRLLIPPRIVLLLSGAGACVQGKQSAVH